MLVTCADLQIHLQQQTEPGLIGL